MSDKLAYVDEDVQGLIGRFNKKHHPVKIYRVLNVIYCDYCNNDILEFREKVGKYKGLDLEELYMGVVRGR